MKKLLFPLLVLVSCATSSPVVSPPNNVYDTVYIVRGDTVHVKITDTLTVRDTTRITDTISNVDTVVKTVNVPYAVNLKLGSDTIVTLYPCNCGDDWPQIQAALNAVDHVKLARGVFLTSQTLLKVNIQNSDYGQTHLVLEGAVPSQDAPSNVVTFIRPLFRDGPVIAAQNCKGCNIKNIVEWGLYIKPLFLTQQDIDTLQFEQWSDSLSRDCPTSPYAGIVIDPFSDPKYLNYDSTKMYPRLISYYLPGMSQSGSTAFEISGCMIENFPVGIMVTAVAQYNGELIKVINCNTTACKSPLVSTQAQAKQNEAINHMDWGGSYAIIEAIKYGIPHGDAATPFKLNGANIAGYNFELVSCDTRAFPFYANDVYCEGLFKIGNTGPQTSSGAGAVFTNCQFDLQIGGPSPDHLYTGGGTDFNSCIIRHYNDDSTLQRDIINDVGDRVTGGVFGAPPIVELGQGFLPQTTLSGVKMYYSFIKGSILNSNNYDSLVYTGSSVYINRANNTGYVINSSPINLPAGTLILTQKMDIPDGINPYLPVGLNSQMPVGYVTTTSGDTTFIRQTGRTMHTGVYQTYALIYKK